MQKTYVYIRWCSTNFYHVDKPSVKFLRRQGVDEALTKTQYLIRSCQGSSRKPTLCFSISCHTSRPPVVSDRHSLDGPSRICVSGRATSSLINMGRSDLPKQKLPQDPVLLLRRFEDIVRFAQSANFDQIEDHSTFQSRGYVAAGLCPHCAKGEGPFQECVLPDGRVGDVCVKHYLKSDTPCNSNCPHRTRGISPLSDKFELPLKRIWYACKPGMFNARIEVWPKPRT